MKYFRLFFNPSKRMYIINGVTIALIYLLAIFFSKTDDFHLLMRFLGVLTGISSIYRGIIIKDNDVIYRGVMIEQSARNRFELVYGIILFALIALLVYWFHLS